MVNGTLAWLCTLAVGFVFTVFNILTIGVILSVKSLRKKPSQVPILALLVVSAIQGLIPTPLYIFKRIAYNSDVPVWLCDVSRLSYIWCGHMLKICFLFISIDRLLAVRYPFRYEQLAKCRKFARWLIAASLITFTIDCIPFNNRSYSTRESCKYVPTPTWGVAVIIVYNILPFCLIAINYVLIWLIAARLSIEDQKLNVCLKKSDFVNSKQQPWQKLRILLEIKATKKSLVLVIVYIFCWGPLGLLYMIDHFCQNCLSDDSNLDSTRAGIKILSSTSSIFLPLVYCWCSQEFRKAARCFTPQCWRGRMVRDKRKEFETKSLELDV